MLRTRLAVVAGLSVIAVHGAASAQEPPAVAPRDVSAWPAAPPPNVVTSPDGSVSVGRTPEAGVDVHAPTPSGTVHAYGCDRVDVDARTRLPTAPCPNAYAYAYPYPVYPAYAYPVYTQPRYAYYYPPQPHKPRHPPDPARSGALIASSLIFGLGTMAAGTAYLASAFESEAHDCLLPEGCGRSEPSQAALYAMGGFLTIPASVPRYVVGEVGAGLLFTALRGGSFALGALVDWEDDSYMMPVTFAFVVPLTLGIVDLATTPHRDPAELTKEHSDSASSSVRLHALGPSVTRDRSGALAPAVSAAGSF